MNYQIAKELSKWDESVIYDVKFKSDTTANLNKLNEILFRAMQRFTIISTSSEALVYKIGRHFIKQKIKFDDFCFIDGKIIETYIGDDSAEWKKKERTDNFFEIFGEKFKGKWVLIPRMSFSLSISLAVYFITSFRKTHAIGVIFYSEGPDNLAEILSYNLDDPDFYEFPKKRYKTRVHQLKEDGY